MANDNAAQAGGTGCADITTAELNVAGNTFSASFPPYSMTVVQLGGSPITMTTAPPAINTQPAVSSKTAGANSTFTVAAAGCPAPTYQWQRLASGGTTWVDLTESTTYTGTQTATLTVNSTTTAMSGDQFRAQTSNSSGSATSSAVALTVTAATTTTPTPAPSTPTSSGGGGGGGGGKLDMWLLLALAVLVPARASPNRGARDAAAHSDGRSRAPG
jgi:hypothetical protein